MNIYYTNNLKSAYQVVEGEEQEEEDYQVADIIWILSLCYDPEVCIIGGDISERVPNLFGWIRDLVKHKSQCEFLPADAQMTNDMALAKSVLDDSFIEIQKQISSS